MSSTESAPYPWTHFQRARKWLRRGQAAMSRGDEAEARRCAEKVHHYGVLIDRSADRILSRPAPRASAHDAALIARAAGEVQPLARR